MYRVLILAAVAATFLASGATAAEKKASAGEHHYFWVTSAPTPEEKCDPSQLASILHEANLCAADDLTSIPSLVDRQSSLTDPQQ